MSNKLLHSASLSDVSEPERWYSSDSYLNAWLMWGQITGIGRAQLCTTSPSQVAEYLGK
jgi:hypothetical protein